MIQEFYDELQMVLISKMYEIEIKSCKTVIPLHQCVKRDLNESLDI